MTGVKYITTEPLDDSDFPKEELDADTKKSVLSFFSNRESEYRAATPLVDLVTGRQTGIDVIEAFRDGCWCWETTDVYHFENYGLALDPDFVRYAIDYVA